MDGVAQSLGVVKHRGLLHRQFARARFAFDIEPPASAGHDREVSLAIRPMRPLTHRTMQRNPPTPPALVEDLCVEF